VLEYTPMRQVKFVWHWDDERKRDINCKSIWCKS